MVSMLRFYKVQFKTSCMRWQSFSFLLGWGVIVILAILITIVFLSPNGNITVKIRSSVLGETTSNTKTAGDLCEGGKCPEKPLDKSTVMNMLNSGRQTPLNTGANLQQNPIQGSNLHEAPAGDAHPPAELTLPKDEFLYVLEQMKKVFCSTLYKNSGIRTNDAKAPDRPNAEKLVLIWNYKCWHSMADADLSTVFSDCPVKNCIATEDKRLSDQSDAIIFNAAAIIRFLSNNIRSAQYLQKTLPSLTQRPPGQRWIFHNRESPCQTYFPSTDYGKQFLGSFNWTMTFRVDSDIYNPYGLIVDPTEEGKRKDYVAIAKSKTKKVAWVVSHCNTASKREQYVEQLSKYISVDVFGKCGQPCPSQDSSSSSCFDYIAKTYKFYLAFENSFSTDYVTEKFYQNAGYDLVIINRGGANYTRLGIKPQWHINTADFASPKDLAEYLLMLDGDDDKYASYLSWKAQHTSVVTQQPIMWCDICRKLNDPTEGLKTYSFKEISEWFYGSSERTVDCRDAEMKDFAKT